MLTYVVAYPTAAVIALVFRFPLPLAGYYSGVQAMIPAMWAVLFYSMLGLVLALVACGAAAGAFVPPHRAGTKAWPSRLELAYSVLASLVPLIILAVLDKIIGPW